GCDTGTAAVPASVAELADGPVCRRCVHLDAGARQRLLDAMSEPGPIRWLLHIDRGGDALMPQLLADAVPLASAPATTRPGPPYRVLAASRSRPSRRPLHLRPGMHALVPVAGWPGPSALDLALQVADSAVMLLVDRAGQAGGPSRPGGAE